MCPRGMFAAAMSRPRPPSKDIYRRGIVMLRPAFSENQRMNIKILADFHNPRVPIGEQPQPQLLVEMVRGYPSLKGELPRCYPVV